MFIVSSGGCKVTSTSSGDLSSFRSDNGERTVAVGFYLNDYPTVTDGAFFPFELFNFSDEEIEEMGDSFKGYSGDVMTGKDPFGGFISEQAITEAKSRKLKDPYHFAGYFLKIMVVHDNIEQLAVNVDLDRGFFPPDFVCPQGVETIKIKANDRALGYPGGKKSLSGDDTFINRTDRQVTFCRVNEVNGPYAGKPLYYTRVELYDKSEDHINELHDGRRSYDNNSFLFKKLPGIHEELSVAVRFKYKKPVDGAVDFNINNTVVNLDYNVIPRLNEMLEVLQQNSTDNYQGIVDSTDMVQEYLYRNRDRAENDGEWQLLKVAQRKWLAIRMILLLMGENINKKAEKLRLHILESLELANLHQLYPLAKKITSYTSASDYINEMTNNPEKSLSDGKDWLKGNSHKHFNEMIYRLAIEAGLRQWYFSKRVYHELLKEVEYDRYIVEYNEGQDSVPLCASHCSSTDRDYIINKRKELTKDYQHLAPIGKMEIHELFLSYVEAINTVYPDPHIGANAKFKRTFKLEIWKESLDYANSSDAYKSLYESYSRRYDLVFSEPHGLLLGADAIQRQVEAKRQPDDVNIITVDGKTNYDWKMHSSPDIITMARAAKQMLDGIYGAIEELTKIKNRIDTASVQEQIKITSDLGDQFHVAPIAQALLIRPDYTYLMKDILHKYSRVRATTVVRHVVYGIAIAATLAGGALLVASFASLASAGVVSAVFAGATVGDLLSASINFAQARGVRHRIERALFSDSLGTNIEVYHQKRQHYYKIQRDLYWSAGFAAIDMAGFVSTGFKFLKTRRQLTNLTEVWKELGIGKYQNVIANLKRCSTPYCRRLLRFSPVLTGGDPTELHNIFKRLNDLKDIGKFKDEIEAIWLTNKHFRPLLHFEIASDAIRSAVLKIPFTNVRLRIPGSHSNIMRRRGLTDARMIYLAKMTDGAFLEDLVTKSKNLTKTDLEKDRADQMLNMMEVLIHGKKRTKRFLFFPRKQSSVLQNQLAMNDKELRELFKISTGTSDQFTEINGKIRNIYDDAIKKFRVKGLKRAERKQLRDLYEEKIELITKGRYSEHVIDTETLDEVIKLGENRERTKILKNNFDNLMGDLAKFNKETKKLVINEAIIGEVLKSNKWKRIVNNMPANTQLHAGTAEQAQTIIDNLNKSGVEALAAYNRRMIKIN